MSTPVPQDLFSRFLAGTFDERDIIGVPTAGLAFFGNPAGASRTIYSPDANTVDITIIRGDERAAALVPRGMVSKSLGSLQKPNRSMQHSEFSRSYPLAMETGDIQASKLTTPVPGESRVNSGITQRDRFRYHAVQIHNENMRRVTRLGEILAWQSILTGKQDAILGTTNTALQYNFLRNSNLTIQCGTSWAGGSANILGDIDGGCVKLRSIGHINPDMMILGDDAMVSFVKDTTVQKLADNRRFTFMSLGDGAVMPAKYQRFVDGGMTFQGNLRTPKGYQLALFTYNEVYTAANGTATKYIAADKVIITSSTARFDRYFGPPEQLPMIPQRTQMYREMLGFDLSAGMAPPNVKGGMQNSCPLEACFNFAYVSQDWKTFSIETQCAPIFATTQTDAVCVLDVEP